MYVCVYAYVYVYIKIHVLKYSLYMYTYVYSVCVHIQTQMYIHAHIHIHTNTYTHIHMHICIHMYFKYSLISLNALAQWEALQGPWAAKARRFLKTVDNIVTEQKRLGQYILERCQIGSFKRCYGGLILIEKLLCFGLNLKDQVMFWFSFKSFWT